MTFEKAVSALFYYEWIDEHAYGCAIATTQLSLLALYWRLFHDFSGARIGILTLVGLTVAWWVSRVSVEDSYT